jgi:hypothetical protein
MPNHRLATAGFLAGLVFALASAPTTAQEAPPAAHGAQPRTSILDRAVNVIHVTGWAPYGAHQTSDIVPSTVQGGQALRVNVTAAGGNLWDAGAGSLTIKPIAQGDVLLLAVWARAERLPDGAATAKLVLGLQQSTAPYTPMATAEIQAGTDWKLYFLQADAPQDYAAGAANATVQLAAASQTIDLGPVFILNYGQGFDKTQLPTD